MQINQLAERTRSFWERVRASWNPQPLEKPLVDPEIENLNPLARSAESIRYSILSIEFWISRNGQLREWLRHNTRLAAWLAFPAFLILPIITYVLAQIAAWAASLVGISSKLVILPILALIAATATSVVIRILKFLGR